MRLWTVTLSDTPIAEKSGMRSPVQDLMDESVIVIDSSTTVHDARRLMQQHRLTAIPLVDTDRRAVGIVSATDLLSNFDPSLWIAWSNSMSEACSSRRRARCWAS